MTVGVEDLKVDGDQEYSATEPNVGTAVAQREVISNAYQPDARSENLFLGVPGDELGIASKFPSVSPPSGFTWKFIAGLWSLIPIVASGFPASSEPIPKDADLSASHLAVNVGSVDDPSIEH